MNPFDDFEDPDFEDPDAEEPDFEDLDAEEPDFEDPDPLLVPPQRCSTARPTVHLVVEVVLAPGLHVPVVARLRYRADEPYTVHLDNHADLPEPVTWALSRDVLLAGLTRPAGLGDMSVTPGRGPDRGHVLLSLHGEEASALLRVPAPALRAFLRRTECVVPVGCERDHVDLDALLRRLLGEDEEGGGAGAGG
ncbi:SsgA family sporulation/cell division regulator [Kitasatospora sp. NPDC001540]|uniref:SsgA family sporulation/cell division regulator n=1 Tax=Kitasatospora sp. NPDC001540 TaxID=3364014 RepID=UPI0036C847A8